jgi:uncharacterized protein YbjT (DUF2867 family)
MPHAPSLIVVTGATGFTGPFVVRELSARFPAARIRCFVRATSRREALAATGVEYAEGDLHEATTVARALEGADTLVNVASLGFDWVDPLFEAIAASRLARGVFVSTTAILTRLAVRSRSQREHGEALVRASRLAWTIVRPTMIYGTPGDRNIARLIRFVDRSPIVPVIAPDALQQPVHVEDVARGVVAAVARDASAGRVYTLSGREPMTFEALVRETVAAVGKRRLVLRMPFAPVLAAARAYTAIAGRPRITVEQIERLREHKAFGFGEAAADLGYAPRGFAEGIRDEVRLVRLGAGSS